MNKPKREISGCYDGTFVGFISSTYVLLIDTMVIGKGKEHEFLLLLALASIIKAMSGKNVTRARKAYNNMDNMTKYF